MSILSPRLREAINRYQQLQAALLRYQQALDLEDDSKRQMKLERDITETQSQLVEVAQTLVQQGLSEVRQLRFKQSFERARQLLEELLSELPAQADLEQALHELSELDQQRLRVKQLITGLSRIRQSDFAKHRNAVANALKRVDGSEAHRDLMEQVELLLDEQHDFSMEDFLFWWESLASFNETEMNAVQEKSAIAARIRSGHTVLFLGSGVSEDQPNEAGLAEYLAEAAAYTSFQGTLSSIAEYYRLKPGLGTEGLLGCIAQRLATQVQSINLYQQLAALPNRLILISSTYDNALEQAFIEAQKPFVTLTSIVQPGRIGQVRVEFSDHNAAAGIYGKEAISGLKLDEYSLVYKLRGACQPVAGRMVERDMLALTETDHFTFARYAEKMIPDYLAGQLLRRPLLFIGYQPRHWEERLLASALLKKREFAGEPCFRLSSRGVEPLEEVFWLDQKVMPCPLDLTELEHYLAQEAQA